MSPEASSAIKIFFSYAHEDEELHNKLAAHLSSMKRRGLIEGWHDRQIVAGEEWASKIDEHLSSAHIILLLISADFLNSDYCYSIEMRQAIERHKAKDDVCVVIPIILRAVDDWANTPFGKFQALPKDGKPVTSWANEDEALANVAGGIRVAVEKLRAALNMQVADNSTQQPVPFRSEEAKAAIIPPPSFWTDFDQPYKGFHRADRNAATYRPDILLIFISRGSVTGPWDDLPAAVLSTANIDIDVLSVEYSDPKPTAKKTQAAAADLRMLLSTTFAAYRHLLFVAHEANLIIKQMLLDDAADVPESATIRLLHDMSFTCRCRSIVSISENRNRRGSGFAKEIADEFDAHLINYDISGLPTPEVLQFSATFSQRPEGETLRQRANQVEGKSQQSSVPRPLTAYLAKRLAPFQSYTAAAIARQTIARTCALDSQVRQLFGSQESISNVGGARPPGHSQETLLHLLTEAASTPTTQSLYVIDGVGGVGKSVVLRMVARRLATIWLSGTTRASLPIVIPLNQFKLDVSDPDPKYVWKFLSDQWTAWANDLLSSNATPEERHRSELIFINLLWIYDQLRNYRTTLILDGIDEFMLNHPNLSLTDFASLLRFLQTVFSENTQLLIIAAVRSSARGATLITESESQILTLREMALSEASAIFPSAASLIGHASDKAVQQLLLTPLILSSLERSDMELKPEAYLNRAALIHAALDAILASLKRVWTGTPYTTGDWSNALSLVAWFQYRELLGDMDDTALADFAARTIETWSCEPCSGDTMEVVAGFRILLDPKARSTLLRHSIFFPVRDNSYRLKHREWGDYLVSRYAVLCIRTGRFDDLSIRALNHDIYIMAGQQLQESDTNQQTVHALVERASTGGRFLLLGNFAQMLGASFAAITSNVLGREILDRLHLFPTVVRFAMLSSLSSRILLNDKRDSWSRHIRPILLDALNKHVHDERENALVKSLCWCFLRALIDTKTPWPGLWQSEQESLDTLSVLASMSGDDFVVTEMHHSIQTAFMRIQFYALEIPSRVISTIHYLYPLVLAYNHEISLDRTVVVELPSLLKDSRLDAVYRNYPVPEVVAIWNRCQELYEEAIVRTPAFGRAS